MQRCISRHCVNTLGQTPPQLSNISAVLYSNSGLVPLAKRPYELRHPDGTVLNGTTDADGYLEHRDVSVGDYALQIDDISGWVPTVRDPKERLPLRIRGYYLIHRTAERKSTAKGPSALPFDDSPAADEWEPLDPMPEEEEAGKVETED